MEIVPSGVQLVIRTSRGCDLRERSPARDCAGLQIELEEAVKNDI